MTTDKATNVPIEIATVTTNVLAMTTKITIAIDMTTIRTREAKEVTFVMTDKEEITIILAMVTTILTSHITRRKSVVALTPTLRAISVIAAALQATATVVLALT
eukprot:142031-Ditylum_brightwellii.AAC.1